MFVFSRRGKSLGKAKEHC